MEKIKKMYSIFSTAILTSLVLGVCWFSSHTFNHTNPSNVHRGMVFIPSGDSTTIGSDDVFEQETPVHQCAVQGFYMDVHPVTVQAFSEFIHASGYVTDADRFGNAGVFNMKTHQWELVAGANWKHPLGPDQPKALKDHPVTQVSWNDAIAYSKWIGKRLPTEIEWEHAARNAGKIEAEKYPWGSDEIKLNGRYRANVWQGLFPAVNLKEDGYEYTSPVGAFGATELGLQDMAGNVWEWCSDWKLPYGQDASAFDPNPNSEKAIRGGSFMCEPRWCHGFRVSGRSGSTPETALFHVGFRCVKDL